MSNYRYSPWHLAGALALAAVIVAGCKVDDNYKLNSFEDIDTQMTFFSEGAEFPIFSSTGHISVDSLLNLGKNNISNLKKAADGKLSLEVSGPVDLDKQIADLNLGDMASLAGISYAFSLDKQDNNTSSTLAVNGSLSDVSPLPELTLLNISKQTQEIVFLSASDIPSQIVSINKVTFDDVNATISGQINGLPAVSGTFHIKADITLPDFFSPSKFTLDQDIDPANPVISFTQKLEGLQNIKPDGKDVTGHVVMDGAITASSVQLNPAALAGNQISVSGDFDVTIGGSDRKIKIGKIDANVSYDASSSESVSLEDLSKTLGTTELTLDVDPEITLDATTNLGFPVAAELVLTPSKNGKDIESNAVVIEGVLLPAATDPEKPASASFFVAGSDKNCPAGATFIKCDLSGVLKTMPDLVRADIKVKVDPARAGSIVPSAKYSCKFNYKVSVPLSFGEEFKVSSSTDIDATDLVEVLEYGSVGFKGKIVNTTPLCITLSTQLIDAEGSAIASAKSSTFTVSGSSAAGTEKVSDFDLTVSVNPSDASKVNKLRLLYTITATPGLQLSANDYIQIKDLILRIPEGVSINYNN